MKKMSKVVLLLGTILTGLGMLIVVITAFTAGSAALTFPPSFNLAEYVDIAKNTNFRENNGKLRTITFENERIQNLSVDIVVGNLQIKKGNNWAVEIDNRDDEGIEVKAFVDMDNTLIVETFARRYGVFQHSEKIYITVYTPPTVNLRDFEIEVGAGSVISKDVAITAREGDFNIDSGSMHLENISLEEASFEVNAGKMNIQNLTSARETDIEVNVGKLFIHGALLGETDIEVNTGSVVIESTESLSHYYFNKSRTLGSITIHNDGMSNSNQRTMPIMNVMDIEVNMGSVKIDPAY